MTPAITVFTSVLGDTDTLRPCQPYPGVQYIAFVDRPFIAPPPYVTVPYYSAGDPRLASRELKICADRASLMGAPIMLWHDAAYQLRCDPRALIDEWLRGADVVAFRHPHRDQIEDEAAVIAQLGYVPAATLKDQIRTYRGEGFQQQAITSTGFCLRRRTSAVEAWQRVWWQEVQRWGWRDQMSVDYALWKTGMTVRYFPGHYRANPYATWQPHAWTTRTRAPRLAPHADV